MSKGLSDKKSKQVRVGSKPMEKENMSKMDYLYLLRKFTKIETLEKIISHKELVLNEDQLCMFYSAADHRRVEIISGKLFDKVPAEAWKLLL